MKKRISDKVAIYQLKSGALQLKTDSKHDTIWANLSQLSDLFDTDKSGISRHINNIYKAKELSRKATVANFAIVQQEGDREIVRNIEHFNLDMILSVGYRVNSQRATHFRKWATKILKSHIVKGYTINPQRIKANYEEFLKAVADIKDLLPSDNSIISNENVIELIMLFSDTWFSLDAYDKDKLVIQGATKRKVILTAEKLNKALKELKKNLIQKNEATDIFGVERTKEAINGIVGNVMQSFEMKDLYPSVEEKAAHLFYFIVKNHPFIDGNKRSGAYAFIWFLRQARILNVSRITPPALTVLTLLIAESVPKDKDKIISLICTLLLSK